MKEIKLEKGPFAGKTLVFETDGETVIVYCPKCGWEDWQTFYIRNFTVNDINRDCPDCGGKLCISMGTNYYWYKSQPCPCCDREHEPLHIGKSSGGWVFALHIIPERDILDFKDWIRLWDSLPNSYIKDEYGQLITPESMKEIIRNRKSDVPLPQTPSGTVPGPNNLLRHQLSNFCVKHGKGTWDCCIGEFS